MSEQNKALASRFFLEVCDGRKPAVADEIFAAAHQYIDPASPGIAPGPNGMKELSKTYYTAFADAYWHVEEQIALDDVVVTRWTAGGTHSASLMGIPATNRRVKVSGIAFQRIRDGKIQETQNIWDALGMLQQLGIVPQLAAK